MAGKARTRKTYGTKLKDQQVDNKTLYTISNQGTVMQATNSIISGGSVSTGNIEWTKVAQEDLNMNTYDINGVDRLRFSTSEGSGDSLGTSDYGMEAIYTGNNAYGIKIQIPEASSDTFKIYRGSQEEVSISQAGIVFTDSVAIASGSARKAKLVLAQYDSSTTPATPNSGSRTLFVDGTNSDNLSVKKSDGSVVDLEATGSSWVGTATSNLNMATYDITSICRLEFDLTGTDTLANGTTGIDATSSKMHFNVPTGDTYNFTQNNDDRFFIGTSQISWKKGDGTPLRIINDLIPDTDDDYDLGSSTKEWKDLYVDGIAYIDTVSAALITVATFSTTGTSNLGDGDTDQVNFYGKTDWKTNTTASSAATGNREGYITIKINGTDKKLYYYS